jgi:hypothetical protein
LLFLFQTDKGSALPRAGASEMPPSLIEQLQIGAVDGASPITDLLRKAKLAAVKLKADDFAAWVELELTGYENSETVPDYRVVFGALKFHNPYRGWQPIFGMDHLNRQIRQPSGELFTLSQQQGGTLVIGVPEEFRMRISDQLGFQVDVKQHISTVAMQGIVDAVRNNVLEWTLKLEKAGIRGEGLSFTPEETKAAQSMFVTNNYHGPVASVAHGTNTIHKISQSNTAATPQEIADAVGALIKALKTEGDKTSTDALATLEDAESELQNGRVPFGKITKAFEFFSKAEDFAMRAPEVASSLHKLGQMLGFF